MKSKQAKENGDVTPERMDELSDQSMPLCMRGLHKGLRRDHKLKHQGRLQYSLFLKGSGMSLEDSIRFFQEEFTRVMTTEAFNKEHRYNLQHSYGKVGNRTSYSAHSCVKIILGASPQASEHHGCPYKHSDVANVSTLLGSMNISGASRDSILTPMRKGDYQVACQRHFEVTHPDAFSKNVDVDIGVGNHPVAWTEASIAYHKSSQENSTPSSDTLRTPEAKMRDKPAKQTSPQSTTQFPMSV
uniref:DNA primase large subunit C-terminal domain-containing protein n=1 Tax=Octactis speculum TaxID=3111310 RepID=A0A7S2MFN3_9STRA